MASKKEWRESSNGPDCLDVIPIMSAIERLHSVHVAVVVSPPGIGSPTTAHVALSAIPDLLPDSGLPSAVTVSFEWPDSQGRSFWGSVYNSLWALDEAISSTYKQESLLE